MTHIRLLNEAELEKAVKLADSIFRDSEQRSMGDAFPNIFSNNLMQSFGAFENNKLVAFMGLVPAAIKINEARLYVYSLGAVCTHLDFRNKGYAGQILQEIKKHIDKAGASLLLVSGDRSLYTRNNCFHFGSIHQFILQGDHAETHSDDGLSSKLQIREIESKDWLKLYETASARTVRYEQSISDLAQLNRSEAYGSCKKLAHKVFVADNNQGSLDFVIIAVPDNTKAGGTPFVVERAGEAKTIKAMLSYAYRKSNLSKMHIPVSWHEKELISELRSLPHQLVNNQGTIHIVDPVRLLKQLNPLLLLKNAELSRGLQFNPLEDGTCNIISNEDTLVNLKPDELVSLIFNPNPAIEINNELKVKLAKLFPIPFPYTAGLNYI